MRTNKPVRMAAVYLGVCVLLLGRGVAEKKGKYLMPPPEFFQPRDVVKLTIQKGDVLSIASFYNAELTKTVRVREDGNISLPLLQSVRASGLTLEQLQTTLTTAYSHEYLRPGLTVDLVSSADNAVYVTGEVGLPGAKEIRGRMTVAMALASAQILEKSGKPKTTYLIRAAKAGRYDVYKLDASFPSGSARSIEVMAGDVLFVPKKVIAKADDFVEMWVRELLPATPSANTSVLFTPNTATALAAAAK